jgi:hypothetical protein
VRAGRSMCEPPLTQSARAAHHHRYYQCCTSVINRRLRRILNRTLQLDLTDDT